MSAPEWVTEHGDRAAPAHEILRTVVGSGVHGIAIAGQDDKDEMGVYIEPPETVFGLGHVDGHYIARTVPEGHRSQHGDTDLTLYSLRRYLALVATGNPTALIPLFAPEPDVLLITDAGRRLRELGPALLSRQAGHRFLGYLRSQRQRIIGQDTRHTPNRPELVDRYGYDVKYASHALRLGMQGVEVLRTGRLTLPLPEDERALVLSVKRGELPMETALALIDSQAGLLDAILNNGRSPLPERPDIAAVTAWSAREHLAHWSARG